VPDLPGVLGVAVVLFASTNVDDLVLLAAFFSDPHLRARSVVAGQFLGIGALVSFSAAAALAVMTVPEGYVAFLGVVPLTLGLRGLPEL
jgi:cadmium resistance protein CadD (predicted permease)